MAWSETGAYVAWDESIAAGKTLSVTYALSEPDVTVAEETSLPPRVKT